MHFHNTCHTPLLKETCPKHTPPEGSRRRGVLTTHTSLEGAVCCMENALLRSRESTEELVATRKIHLGKNSYFI